MAKYQDYVDLYAKQYAADKKRDINENKKTYTSMINVVKDNYNSAVDEINLLYDDAHRQNAVQLEINKRDIAGDMADMGTTESGLNRTQMTAAQVSYGNNRADIEEERQMAVDKLNREMASAVSQLQTEYYGQKQNIQNNYRSAIAEAANDAYKTDVNAETARYKAQVSASAKSSKSSTTSSKTSKYFGLPDAEMFEIVKDAIMNKDVDTVNQYLRVYAPYMSEADQLAWENYMNSYGYDGSTGKGKTEQPKTTSKTTSSGNWLDKFRNAVTAPAKAAVSATDSIFNAIVGKILS